MKKIVAFHKSLEVDDKIIQLSLDNWYDDEEILQLLTRLYRVRTIGELVAKIRSEPIPKNEQLLSCEVVPAC